MKYKDIVFILLPVLMLVSLLWASMALGQREAPPEAQAAETDAGGETNAAASRLELLEKQISQQNSRIETLEQKEVAAQKREAEKQKEMTELQTKLEETQDTVEMLSEAAMEETDERRFLVYGFFDVTFIKSFFKNDKSLLKSQNPPYSTFMMNNVNLYFKSEMTDTLEALVETGLSFAPHGYETNLPIDAYIDGELYPDLVDSSHYTRIDTTVPGGIASQSLRYGSISIIRAYLDWEPIDWFGVRVGQYLTPYGIWNEEHASTVLTGVFYPNLMNWDLLPKTQMGLQFFGTVYPSTMIQLKYALTLSNGRGPMDSVMDLDENKAVGLRLKGVFSGTHWTFRLGGYGYVGKYTDIQRRGEAYMTVGENGSIEQDLSDGTPIGSTITITEQYTEKIGTLDLSLELYGVKVFGEYVYRRVDFEKHASMFSDYEFVQNGDLGSRKAASHLSRSIYGILSWTLPLRKYIEPVEITPYMGYDWIQPDDSFDWFKQKTTRFGVNVRPSPFVVLKAEGIIDNFDELIGGKMTSISAQAAVSF